MVVNFIHKPVYHFQKMKDVGHPFRLNKEIIKLISIFSNEPFDVYKHNAINQL